MNFYLKRCFLIISALGLKNKIKTSEFKAQQNRYIKNAEGLQTSQSLADSVSMKLFKRKEEKEIQNPKR